MSWCSLNVKEVLENDPEAYYSKEELLENLLIMHKSLEDTKDDSIANGKLLDVIRQVGPMGLPLHLLAWSTICWALHTQEGKPGAGARAWGHSCWTAFAS